MAPTNPLYGDRESTRKPLGEVLFDLQFARRTQVREILEEQKRLGPFRRFRIGELLVFSRIINQAQLEAALRKQGRRGDSDEISIVGRHAARAAVKDLLKRSKRKKSLWDRIEAHFSRSPVLRGIKSFFSGR